MNIPDTEQQRNDVIALLTDAAQKVEFEEQEDGKLKKVFALDVESIYWETRSVDSPSFARSTLELKNLESKADQCYFHMSKERADVISKQIKDIVANYRYSIDAKSSETRLDRNNAKPNLIDRLLRNRQEKIYNLKEQGGKSLLEGMGLKKAQRETELD